MKRTLRLAVGTLVCLSIIGGGLASAEERIIVRTKKPYDTVKQKIGELGGTITHEFEHANGLVAVIPDGRIDAVEKIAGVEYVARDEIIPNPRPREAVSLAQVSPQPLSADAMPANYHSYNAQLTNVFPLQAEGFLGQNVVVGIIDSGTSSSAAALCNNANCAQGSRVIGGENFVPGATEPGATAATNDPHGTWVATMVGANAAFLFTRTGALATSVRNHCNPVSTQPCSVPASPIADAIFMVGQAPATRFYALKVFPANGGGAPTSRILQAMERAIELKNTTQPNMHVVNMSLGGATLHAGRDLEDELASSMADAGISLVVSAGNTGPSGSTVGSPGTALNILTVGAASSAVHERILRDIQFGSGIGLLWRPDSNHQIADFSSRGPNADGRVDPEVVANGFASFAQGANGGISLVSGTSFSAPTVSGVLAALYSYKPSATPAEMRAAIIASARPDMIPTATAVDQGAGYVNAAAARALLDLGAPDAGERAVAKKQVSQNVHQGAGIVPINASDFSARLANLRPGERREFYYDVKKNTALVRLSLSNLVRELPEAQQNALFGDDLLVAVHSAKTSSIGATGDYLFIDFVTADQTLVFNRPEIGLMRITVLGDSTNAGRISVDVRIQEEHDSLPTRLFKDQIAEGDQRIHTVDIPAGTASVTFRLSWDGDWSSYPTNDLDMVLVPPVGNPNFQGATLDSPETVTIANPTPGTWTIFVDGFTVHGRREKYEVRVQY
jgi:subtilisin family serine protease